MTTRSSIGRKSKRKGRSGEQEVVKLWQRLGFDRARRGYQYRDGSEQSDVLGVPFWVEVKRYRHLLPSTWANAWNQGMAAMILACEREKIPDLMDVLVIAREDRKRWTVLMAAQTLYELGYRGENHQFQHPNLVDGIDLRKIEWTEFVKLVERMEK